MALKDRIRIRLKAHDHRVLDQSATDIVEAARRTGASAARPTAEINPYKVLRAPQVEKNTREQFEIRTHKRLLDILEPTQQTIDALMRLELPAGVGVEIKSFPKAIANEISAANRGTAHQPFMADPARQSVHTEAKSAEVELSQKALDIIGSTTAVARWMQTPLSALGGHTPYSLLNSVDGRKQVEIVLGRMQHGIF